MDPDYLDEIVTRLRAENVHNVVQAKKQKRQAKRRSSGRNTEIVDADLSEII